MSRKERVIETGAWSDDVQWELFSHQVMLPYELITAVFCLAIDRDNKIVLARPQRGWGLLGGHIEDGESVEAALWRESQEEGGFTPNNPQMFAYKKITSSKSIRHQDPGKHYPYPTSYIVYYWARTIHPIAKHTGLEIIESASFTLEEARLLGMEDLSIIELGHEAFLKYPE